MALLKVSEFAERYNLNRTNIYTYRGRGKLILIDGYLDESNPINKIFIESRETSGKVKIKPNQKKNKEHVTMLPKAESIENTKAYKDTKNKTDRLTTPKDKDPAYLNYQRTEKLKEQKLEEEIRMQKLKTDAYEKKLIPTAAVSRTVGELLNRYRMTFLQQTEQLIRDTLNELLAGNEKITSTCSKLTDIANESTKRAASDIRAMVNTITNDIN